jgi:hypothetical protein
MGRKQYSPCADAGLAAHLSIALLLLASLPAPDWLPVAEASMGGSAGSGSGREEEEDLDQLPLAARLQRIREREGHLGHRGSSAVNDAPTQAHRLFVLKLGWGRQLAA